VTGALGEKLTVLSAAAEFDACAECSPRASRDVRDLISPSITRLHLPRAGCLSVLKVLQTNACEYDCLYCANRAERRCRRYALKPEDLAAGFADLHARGIVNGLFLSSGINGSAAATMARMIDTVEIIRTRYDFRGYVHLKVLPGAPYDCIERAVLLADRLSVNVEAPTQQALDHLSTRKHLYSDVIQRMHWIRRAAQQAGEGVLRSGQTTQFVIGAAGESDRETLNAVEGLRRSVGLRRAYFSAFSPIGDTPLADEPPAPALRQHRLYQADWLLREYGFHLGDLVFDETGNLPMETDPKLAFAARNPQLFPIEVNRASRADLLRVPGIGPRSAARILAARARGRLTSVDDLRNLGVPASRAAPFLLIDGRPGGDPARILSRRTRASQLGLPLACSA